MENPTAVFLDLFPDASGFTQETAYSSGYWNTKAIFHCSAVTGHSFNAQEGFKTSYSLNQVNQGYFRSIQNTVT